MNTKICLLFLLAACFVGFVAAKPQEGSTECGENAEYTTCGNICPPKCEGGHRFCSLRCFPGCQCKTDYLLNKEGKCILQKDC